MSHTCFLISSDWGISLYISSYHVIYLNLHSAQEKATRKGIYLTHNNLFIFFLWGVLYYVLSLWMNSFNCEFDNRLCSISRIDGDLRAWNLTSLLSVCFDHKLQIMLKDPQFLITLTVTDNCFHGFCLSKYFVCRNNEGLQLAEGYFCG